MDTPKTPGTWPRVIPIRTEPEHTLDLIRKTGGVIRRVATDWRGPLVFLHDSNLIATADLVDCTPTHITKACPEGEGYLWRLENLTIIEPIPCPDYNGEALFDNGKYPQPQMLMAGAARALREQQERVEAPEPVAEPPIDIFAAPTEEPAPDEPNEFDAYKGVGVDPKREGQLLMF